jgi:TonB family protein
MFRDELEALQARARTLESELEAERKRREAAEAEARAAQAACDEARAGVQRALKAGASPTQKRPFPTVSVSLIAAIAVGTLLLAVQYRKERQRSAVFREQLARAEAQRQNEREKLERQAIEDIRAKAASQPAEMEPVPERAREPERPDLLSRTTIQRVIRLHKKEVQLCYERELHNKPDLGGRVTLHFSIGATGQVVAAHVSQSTLQNASAERCIVQAVKRWTFPKPADRQAVTITYPFVLRPE